MLSVSKNFINQLRAALFGTKRQSLHILFLFPNPEKSGAEKTAVDSQGPPLRP